MRGFPPQEIKRFITERAFSTEVPSQARRSAPRISVVVPSYNQGRFIERTLLSILNQNYLNTEIIVIDGGSDDETIDVLKRYEPFLAYWHSRKDKNHADALAQGFAKSTGDVLAWLNSDDIYCPGALGAISRVFRSSPQADVVTGNLYQIDTDDRILSERRQTRFLRSAYLYGAADLLQPPTFWRRELYGRCGGVDSAFMFSMDTDLFFRFITSGANVSFLRQFLAAIRIHPDSKTSRIRSIGEAEDLAIRERHGIPSQSGYGKIVRTACRAWRLGAYIAQGDAAWLAGRISLHLPFVRKSV